MPLRRFAASPLRRVSRELHAVDREHLAPDQTLRIADGGHAPEHVRDVGAERANEVRDRGEVRRVIAAERDERDVLTTRLGDRAAADEAVGVRDEDDLEEERRRVRGGAGGVVPEAGIEGREIDGVVEQVVHGVREGAGEELAREVDGEEARIRVDVLVAGHGRGSGRGQQQRCRQNP